MLSVNTETAYIYIMYIVTCCEFRWLQVAYTDWRIQIGVYRLDPDPDGHWFWFFLYKNPFDYLCILVYTP